MNRLDKAIADFEDESLDLDLGQRLSLLRDGLSLASYDILKVVNKFGSNCPHLAEMEYKHNECLKRYKIMHKLYMEQMQQNKMLGKAQNDGMESKDFLQKIKKEKGSISDIVRDLKPSDN